jgi:2-polyprenyl-3-methyl-5-hydroxy-6-metoxy-1,4-benzoquinol methylase/glycosyltransferase involved in cell wall biosynthesis
MSIEFTGERIVPEAQNCEPTFAEKMYQEHVARYHFASQLCVGKSVLDVGCGVGYGSQLLARKGAGSVLAFDLSEAAIAHAAQHFSAPNLAFVTANAESFEFGKQFQLITCFELIEHVNQQEPVFECIARSLTPDGVVVMSTPRALADKRTHFHTHEYSRDEFEQAFLRHFKNRAFYFENNHFSSYVGKQAPHAIAQVELMRDQFTLDAADYFVAVASHADDLDLSQLQPVLVLNDDSYVMTLEKDIGVLRTAEADHTQSISTLRSELAKRERAVSDALDSAAQFERQFTDALKGAEQREASLAAEARALAARAAATDEKLLNLTRQYHAQQMRLVGLQDELTRCVADRDNYQHMLRETRASFSWRVTRPMRDTKTALRRLKASSRSTLAPPAAAHDAAADKPFSSSTGNALTDTKVPEAHFDAVMFIGCWEGESKRYRVYNVAEAMRDRGLIVEIQSFDQISQFVAQGHKAKLAVLFRAPYDPPKAVDQFLKYAREQQIRTVFDIDDMVFAPEIVPLIHGFAKLSATDRNLYQDGVRKYRQLLMACDLVTVTTPFLKREVEKLGKACVVIPNTVNAAQLEIASKLVVIARVASPRVTIGYFSGSNTHERDFAEAAPALRRLMTERPEVDLLVVGILELNDQDWLPFANRIIRKGFQDYRQMLETVRGCDINIAPLEQGNPFCESKSELKFFEAALVEVPTIASSTEPFRLAIEHGKTGFIASSNETWLQHLLELVVDPELRARIGKAARSSVLTAFGPERLAQITRDAWQLEFASVQAASMKNVPVQLDQPAPTSLRAASNPSSLRIDWVIPELIVGGGGHRNILRAAFHLSRFGHDICLHFTGERRTAAEVKKLIRDNFYPLDCEVRLYDGVFRRSDVVMATHWTTVDAALQARSVSREIMYFVQDFEPSFAPMGSEYVLAENTYRRGLYCVTSGPWCEHVLKNQFGAEADHFRFPIDRDVYYPRARTKSSKSVVFFAKPEMPRRCFEIGAMALSHLHNLMPEVEIKMFGSPSASRQKLTYPVTFNDMVPTIDDLAQMYSNTDVGLVFSTTNPSLVPYEMMACGLPVVDLGRPGNEVNYAGRSDIALLANPLPEEMAKQIAGLLVDPVQLSLRSKNGLAFAAEFPTEEQMAKRVEELILQRMKTRSFVKAA